MRKNVLRNRLDQNARRYPAMPCTKRLMMSPIGPAQPEPAAPEPYGADELSHAEAARLARAKSDAEAAIVASTSALQSITDRLADTWRHSSSALQQLVMLERSRELQYAAQEQFAVERRHRSDGPEDRRTQPKWLSWWFVWPMIILSAVYDTVFLSEMFMRALDEGSTSLWIRVVSYVPGFGVAIALILAGSWLAVPLFRYRSRVERRNRRRRSGWQVLFRRASAGGRPEDEWRKPADLPWPSWGLPIAFACITVAVLGIWGWLRVLRLRSIPPWAMVALLLLLTIAAIALKASAYNPYKERADSAKKRIKSAERRYTKLETRARQALAQHQQVWQELQTRVEEVLITANRPMVEAWAEISEERARHGLTGPVAPKFLTTDHQNATFQVFQDLTGPPLYTDALRHARETLQRYDPELLSEELNRLLTQLNQQLTTDEPELGQWKSTGTTAPLLPRQRSQPVDGKVSAGGGMG